MHSAVKHLALATVVIAAGASGAQARTNVNLSIGTPVYYEPAPVVYRPAPVYYAPAPVYRYYYPVGYRDGRWRHREYDWHYWDKHDRGHGRGPGRH